MQRAGFVKELTGFTVYFRGFAPRNFTFMAPVPCPPLSSVAGGFHDPDSDPFDRPAIVALTAAEAEALRARDPSLSPWRVVRAQAVAGFVCVVLASLLMERASAGWSAFYGAAATVLPSALMARGMTRGARSAVAAAAAFMVWEMLKIGVAVAMLVIAARVVPDLSWPALLVTMVVCIKINWLALLWRGPKSKKTKA